MRVPKRFRPGDTVGIISPSSPITPEAIEAITRYFERRGHPVKVAPNALARFGFMAGTPKQRADDLNLMLRDPEVRMIIASRGGAGAAHLLPLIDYAALEAAPKFLVGLSDPSILLNAITARTGVATYHGPNGVKFGVIGPLTRFSEDNFWTIVGERLELPYAYPVVDAMHVIREGSVAEGPLFGGHLKTNQVLLGTPWAPEWRGAILLIEEMEVGLARMDAMLAHLRLAGVLDSIAGLIVGQYVSCDAVEAETLEEIVLRNCAGTSFPIVMNVPIGHTDDKITVPIGCRVRVDSRRGTLELIESPTE